MRRSFLTAALLCGALLPAHVDAKAIEDMRLAADANDLIITVLTDEPLKTPTIRTGAGVVRVRFYDVAGPLPKKVEGDGSALRTLELTRGSDGTAAIAIMLGDQTRLAPADIRVQPEADGTTLRIARGLLPPLSDSPNVAPALAVTPAPAQPVAKPVEPVTVPAAQQPTEAPAGNAVEATATEKPAAPTLGKPRVDSPKPEQRLTGVPQNSALIPVLITISIMLALSYVALQLILRKRRNFGTDLPIIDVVAQQKLGPRHQLVIVRAFDRDYLLSIQGGQTTVVARSSRRKAALEAVAAVERAKPSARRAELTSELRASVNRDFEEDDEPTFGGELFKHALEQRERAREQTLTASQAVDRARSQAASLAGDRAREQAASYAAQRARESVSSLSSDRPREQTPSASSDRPVAGGFPSDRVRAEPHPEFEPRLEVDRGAGSEDGRILGNDNGRTRTRSGGPERRPAPGTEREPISERVPIAERAAPEEPAASSSPAEASEAESVPEESQISDSVSGLLRLRKQAGR